MVRMHGSNAQAGLDSLYPKGSLNLLEPFPYLSCANLEKLLSGKQLDVVDKREYACLAVMGIWSVCSFTRWACCHVLCQSLTPHQVFHRCSHYSGEWPVLEMAGTRGWVWEEFPGTASPLCSCNNKLGWVFGLTDPA